MVGVGIGNKSPVQDGIVCIFGLFLYAGKTGNCWCDCDLNDLFLSWLIFTDKLPTTVNKFKPEFVITNTVNKCVSLHFTSCSEVNGG